MQSLVYGSHCHGFQLDRGQVPNKQHVRRGRINASGQSLDLLEQYLLSHSVCRQRPKRGAS
jgi:hypothetical protein